MECTRALSPQRRTNAKNTEVLRCVASREVNIGKVHNHSEEYLPVVWCGALCLLVDNVTAEPAFRKTKT